MNAQVGDRLVVQGNKVGAPQRAGTVLEVLPAKASPEYRVRWDDGHESVICPGSDARIEPQGEPDASEPPQEAVTQVELRFEEDADHTDAWATLRTPVETFTGWGRARRNPVDPNVPLIGEELAAARALIALADSLRHAAGAVIAEKQRPESHLVG